MLLATKVLLIWRMDINWDEFNFLSHVHELTRGELRLVLQGAYTHLFTWLPYLPGDEMTQTIVARCVMLALLAATAYLTWKLASQWTSAQAALLAPLCYLAMLPILKHGASFRFDSLLAPLTVLTVLLLAAHSTQKRALITAAICQGLCAAISIKAILLAPVFAILIVTARPEGQPWSAAAALKSLLLFGLIAGSTAAILLAAHRWSIAAALAGNSAGSFAAAAFNKVILKAPLFSRGAELRFLVEADRFPWTLIIAGALCALDLPRYRRLLACALSLLPLVFYRNAWPYYYVVMLAPACIFAAVAADSLQNYLAARQQQRTAHLTLSAMAALLLTSAAVHATGLLSDEQTPQRKVIAAVHQIFPQPVPYIDHSGMMASFRKANFFMSTWGLQDYRAQGQSFMAEAIARYKPPLLLANRPMLDPASPQFQWLLPEDRELIERFYLKYWGPIRVAGAMLNSLETTARTIALPFPGRYRLESPHPVVLNGMLQHDGAIIEISVPEVTVALAPAVTETAPFEARLLIADAQAAPPDPGFFPLLYSGL